jgi:hypothetical protein
VSGGSVTIVARKWQAKLFQFICVTYEIDLTIEYIKEKSKDIEKNNIL